MSTRPVGRGGSRGLTGAPRLNYDACLVNIINAYFYTLVGYFIQSECINSINIILSV